MRCPFISRLGLDLKRAAVLWLRQLSHSFRNGIQQDMPCDRLAQISDAPGIHRLIARGLVDVRTADFVDRARGLPLLIFRAAERVVTLVLDLGLVMGAYQVGVAPSATPPQPRPGKLAGRARPRSGLSCF
jgi:hypothetical protein